MFGEVTKGLLWILGGSKNFILETISLGYLSETCLGQLPGCGPSSPHWAPALAMIDSV